MVSTQMQQISERIREQRVGGDGLQQPEIKAQRAAMEQIAPPVPDDIVVADIDAGADGTPQRAIVRPKSW